jgi:hypothetical protein
MKKTFLVACIVLCAVISSFAQLSITNAEINKYGFKGTTITSASTVDLGAASGDFIDITGNTTITSFGTAGAGIVRTLRFTSSLTLTHNATTLILPGSANISASNGDVGVFRSLGSGNWKCIDYMPVSGKPVHLNGSYITDSGLSITTTTDQVALIGFSPTHQGVYGQTGGSGNRAGVFGEATAGGAGVFGQSESGPGIKGISNSGNLLELGNGAVHVDNAGIYHGNLGGGTNLYGVTLAANQSVRRNAADDGFEAFIAQQSYGLTLAANESVRRNAADDGFEAFIAQQSYGLTLAANESVRRNAADDGFEAFIAQENYDVTLGAGQSIRRNAADDGFEAFIAESKLADDSSTPTDTGTVAGWIKIKIGGVDSWIPYYR